jgi:hypothetical protein
VPVIFLIGVLHRRDCRLQSRSFHAKLCLSASPFRPLEGKYRHQDVPTLPATQVHSKLQEEP